MKAKASKQPKRLKPEFRLKDIKPKRNAIGGNVRGGVYVAAGFVTNNRDSE
jgi:hypothetical protein